MVTLFQIDKSGSDIFEKDYSIVVVLNRENVYGINVPKKIKDELVYRFKIGDLGINGKSAKKSKNRFRLRFHSAIVIKIVEKIIFDLGSLDDVSFQVCNDFDGHFHEIKDMMFRHFSKIIPNLKPEDILQTKFSKPSLIDDSGKALRNRDKNVTGNFIIPKLEIMDVLKIVRK